MSSSPWLCVRQSPSVRKGGGSGGRLVFCVCAASLAAAPFALLACLQGGEFFSPFQGALARRLVGAERANH